MSEVRAEMNRRSSMEQWLDDQFPDIQFTLLDGLESAFVGIVSHESSYYTCYDEAQIIEVLEERDGMTFAEAVDYLNYNIIGLLVPPTTPAILVRYRQ